MVLEGVHLVPGMLTPRARRASSSTSSWRSPDETLHEQHFLERHELSAGERARDKYLDPLRRDPAGSRTFIVGEAGKAGVRVVENDNIEQAIGTVIELVFEQAAGSRRSRESRRAS